LQNTPMGELALPQLAVSPLDIPRETAKFDVTVVIEDGGNRLVGAFEYSTDLFDHETIERMAGHFENLLDRMTRSPGARVSEADFLGPGEAETLLHTWNDAAADYPRDHYIHALFERRAAERPDAIALTSAGASPHRARRQTRHARSDRA
jgi:non-ribosomal peptide synthetase component F